MNKDETREARESDLPGIIELYAQLVPEDPQQDMEKLRKEWKHILSKSEEIRYFVAEKNGKIVSTCNIAIVPNLTRGVRPFAVIENVVTHADYRMQGQGARVMRMALDFARSKNCYKAMLLSNSKRKEAHLFYKSLGFSDTTKIGFVIDL
jgi:N-acetylglutamate synthase-like GNAT family acetyltransferase